MNHTLPKESVPQRDRHPLPNTVHQKHHLTRVSPSPGCAGTLPESTTAGLPHVGHARLRAARQEDRRAAM